MNSLKSAGQVVPPESASVMQSIVEQLVAADPDFSSLTVIIKLLTNVTSNPEEQKYRQVHCSNLNITSREAYIVYIKALCSDQNVQS